MPAAIRTFVPTEMITGPFEWANQQFTLPKGTIVARHRTTVQPLLDPNSPASHSAVSFPLPETMNVVSTGGEFKGMTGQVRILGAMNLQNFHPGADSAIKFNEWVYLIQLNKPGGDGERDR